MITSAKTISFIVSFFIFNFSALAQSLPKTQKISLQAPIKIKIDGKADEWDNKFQAYNTATDIFYTIANDDEKLYVVIQAPRADIINKIALGGITLTINASGTKKDKNSVRVTFPKYEKKDGLFVLALNNSKPTDSLMNKSNKRIADKFKIIEVTGVKKIDDSLLSIYNTTGIKAAAFFDNRLALTYELAIPLKYLRAGVQKFYYNIRLNGAAANNNNLQASGMGRFIVVTGADGGSNAIPVSAAGGTSAIYPTDFWAEYTLAKK